MPLERAATSVFAFPFAGLLAISCARPAPRPPDAPSPEQVSELQAGPGEAPAPLTPGAHVDWDALAFVGDLAVFPRDVLPATGTILHVRSADGRDQELSLLETESCDEQAPPPVRACQLGWLEFEGAWEARTEVLGLPEPSAPSVVREDIAVLPYKLGSTGTLPPREPARFTVHYHRAACTDAEDERVALISSSGAGPLDFSSLTPGLADEWPRRTVSVHLDGLSLHFVTAGMFIPTQGQALATLPENVEEAIWVVLERDGEFKILEHRRAMVRRGMNHDHACQLPIQFPLPFEVVRDRNEVVVFTAESLGTFRQLRLREETLIEDVRWDLRVPFELF